MEEINERELEWLFSKGYLRCVRGKIPGLITGTKGKSGKSKFVKVEEPIYEHVNFVPISIEEKDLLIKYKYLKQIKGEYPDLIIKNNKLYTSYFIAKNLEKLKQSK